MKKNNYILIGLALVTVGIIVFWKKKPDLSDFSGITKEKLFNDPYVKAKDESGRSRLFRLSEYFTNPVDEVADYMPIEILGTRIMDGIKYYRIEKDKWIDSENVIIPKK